MRKARRQKLHTIGLSKPLLSNLQIVHLVDNLLDNTLDFAHLGLEARKGFLVGNSTEHRKTHISALSTVAKKATHL